MTDEEPLIKGRLAKEGMNLERKIAGKWNDAFNTKKKKENKNPRLDINSMISEPKEKEEEEERAPSYYKNHTHKKTYGRNKKDEAKRQINSGAMWFAKGDIRMEHALMEVKERGTFNGRGEKTISIPKRWLTKQEEEAFQEGRPFWYLSFAYKDDDEVYLIKSFDQELEMIQDLRRITEENEKLKEENETLKKEK